MSKSQRALVGLGKNPRSLLVRYRSTLVNRRAQNCAQRNAATKAGVCIRVQSREEPVSQRATRAKLSPLEPFSEVKIPLAAVPLSVRSRFNFPISGNICVLWGYVGVGKGCENKSAPRGDCHTFSLFALSSRQFFGVRSAFNAAGFSTNFNKRKNRRCKSSDGVNAFFVCLFVSPRRQNTHLSNLLHACNTPTAA